MKRGIPLRKVLKKVVQLVAGLLVLYTWLIHPNTKRRKQMELFLKTDYAHRGLHGAGVPENSLTAFARAAERGYGMEFDVQLSQEGIPVVFHDSSLGRVCHIEGVVEEMTLEELRVPLEKTEEILPTFREVLDTVRGRVPLLIELKMTKRKEQLVEAVLDELKSYSGLYLIESFDPMILRVLRKKAPDVLIGQLSGGLCRENKSLSRFLADRLLWNVYSRPDFIAYYHPYGRRFLTLYAKIFRVPIFSFTIKNQRDYHRKGWYSRHIFEGFLPPPGA